MRLDPESLQVQSFATSPTETSKTTVYDTGPDGPPSQCYICYNTDFGLPTCPGGRCGYDTGPDGPPSHCWVCYNTDFGLPSCDGGRC
ncbi:MAG TPA: hypothetical protein VHG91_19415 [Longimicrobium sp.]|nr:hypothetical protein [Longimicrobium sp.]